MAVTVTSQDISIFPVANFIYTVTGLVNGANTVTLPVPPKAGSFPVAGDWTPTLVLCFPYNTGAISGFVTPDLTSITNSSGSVAFTVYANGAANCYMVVM